MSGYHLCQVKKAVRPYYIASISTNIYTIEELCFYLQQNIYLIDKTIMNETLCNWIKDELGLKKLYQKLYARIQSEEEESIAGFILPIFKEINYLSAAEYKSMQEQISRIEIQPDDLRRKMKADYLVSYEMYGNAIKEYYQILRERNPGNLGIQFYASILNNMAAAYAHLFLFEEAADCLWQSYGIVRSGEVWRRYLSVLPLFMDQEVYHSRLKELSVPKEQITKIETKNRALLKENVPAKMKNIEPREFLEKLREKYYKCAGS